MGKKAKYAQPKPKQQPKYRWTATRIVIMAIALLLALLMFGSLFWNAIVSFAITQSDVNAIRNKLAAATKQKNALSSQLGDIKSDKSAVQKQLTLLDEQLEAAEDEIALQEDLLEGLASMVETKTVELQNSEAEEQTQYAAMKDRVRFMVEHGNMSYLEILLSADDFSDFLYRYEIISQISARDQSLFESLKAVREQVQQQKADLEATQAEEKEVYTSLQTNQAALESQRNAKQKALDDISAMEVETKDAYAALIDKEDELMDQYRKAAAELAAQQTYVGGTFMWPLPRANNIITCKYGYRVHPITGKYKLHTGIDLRATTGTKIYAANGGTITTSAYSSVWGNYVIINHGGGYTTLYAHMSKRLVSTKQKVKQGEVIGYVGSTGYSTGSHLHFEISKNGSTFNPMEEFKGFSVVYK
jgi:Membrane proteins related to metalloendopeptidases